MFFSIDGGPNDASIRKARQETGAYFDNYIRVKLHPTPNIIDVLKVHHEIYVFEMDIDQDSIKHSIQHGIGS